LERAALDPAAWGDACDTLAGLVGGVGAILAPTEPGVSAVALPHSASLAESHRRYVEEGWHNRNPRIVDGFPKALHQGHVTDQDIIAPEAMRRHPYYAELLAPFGLEWFAAVTFAVHGKLWVASVQGAAGRGPFLSGEVETLLRFREHLGLAAKRTAALGRERIESLEAAFADSARGLLALDAQGRISWLNAAAEAILREAELAPRGRLRSQDPFHDRRLSDLIEGSLRFRWASGVKLAAPVRIRTTAGRKFSVDAVPMPRDFQALVSGATVLVTIHEVEPTPRRTVETLRSRFGLTAREAALADQLRSGATLAEAAAALRMSLGTARTHLKAIFAKTGVSRQAQLVALLNGSSG
jgi:DNA-binding CsgD family transcriptional regulator